MGTLKKSTKPFSLYHLSEHNLDGQILEPRPMDKNRVMEGEDWKKPRICVSTSIDGAVSALADSLSDPFGLKLYVHVPENLEELFANRQIYKPSTKQVPDAEVTGEHWLTGSARFKCLGQIELIDFDDENELTYIWNNEKMHLDRFVWKWTIQRM